MARLLVRDVCPDSRVFRGDGERLRRAIENAWAQEPVDLDFGSELIASISFLDEGVAALFVDHDAEVIRERLRIVGLTDADRQLLNELVARRRAQRSAA
jgi:hypothetical protein